MLLYLLFLVTAAIILSSLRILPYKPLDLISSGAYLVAVCYLSNKFFAYLFNTKPNLESRSITALILALIIGPLPLLPNIWFLTFAGVAAMASKYLLVWKQRHIFNPAAFGVLATALILGQGASWWVGNKYLFPLVILGGLLLAQKIRRFHLIMSFLATYLGLSILLGVPVANLLLHSPILFFAFVMLAEPLTAPQSQKLRLGYGVFIALLLIVFQKFFPAIPYSLELSLLAGNLAARIQNPDIRGILTLRKKEKLDTDIYPVRSSHGALNPHGKTVGHSASNGVYGFWFEPPQKSFDFVPGQYLEWTLPHSHPDSRGIRRYFTIASSPTEKYIFLATRISEGGSSFKTKLMAIERGDEIIVSNREGEFILPPDQRRSLVFIAGGIGITPFRSIIRYLLDTNQKRDIVLLYSNRTAADAVFKDIFAAAQDKIGLRLRYVNTDAEGYINEQIIKQEVPDCQKALFYLSGPIPMVEAFEKLLVGMGVQKRQIKEDYFHGY